MMQLKEGMKAPDFEGIDQYGKVVKKKHPVILSR